MHFSVLTGSLPRRPDSTNMDANLVRQEIYRDLKQLTLERVHEVRDFVGYLLNKQESSPQRNPNVERDPILDLIGAIDIEPFAHRVDDELYGR